MSINSINIDKIIQALSYLASKSSMPFNKMKAYKLLWLADRYHLRMYARTITGDVYYALPFGPIPTHTKDILDGNLFPDIVKNNIQFVDQYNYSSINNQCDYKELSESDRNILDIIYDNYGQMDCFELANLSHNFPEWLRYKKLLDNGDGKAFRMRFEDFFINYEDSTKLFVNDDKFLDMVKCLYEDMN